jgi:trehalose 6-phosphate synthase/phosphatase
VGFQTSEYCQFIHTCSRIFRVEATNEGVHLDNRFVNVGTGIDLKSWDERRKSPDVDHWMEFQVVRAARARIV